MQVWCALRSTLADRCLFPTPCRAAPRTQSGVDATRTPTPLNGTPAPLEPPFWIQDPEHVYTEPSLEAISKMSLDERRRVRDFVVGDVRYGKVHFMMPVDLNRLQELHHDKVMFGGLPAAGPDAAGLRAYLHLFCFSARDNGGKSCWYQMLPSICNHCAGY